MADYIQSEFPQADIGDRFTFDTVEIIIRMKKNGQIIELGIDVSPQHHTHTTFQNVF